MALLEPYLWNRTENTFQRHFNEKPIITLGCPGCSNLDLMVYYSKVEQVSLARRDLWHMHLASVGTWKHWLQNLPQPTTEFWQLTSCLLA